MLFWEKTEMVIRTTSSASGRVSPPSRWLSIDLDGFRAHRKLPFDSAHLKFLLFFPNKQEILQKMSDIPMEVDEFNLNIRSQGFLGLFEASPLPNSGRLVFDSVSHSYHL